MKEHSIYVTNQPLAEAQRIWRERLAASGFFNKRSSRTVAVDDALGALTAAPVFAAHSSPSYNASAMDGVAVHFKDLDTASEATPVRLSAARFQPVNTGNAVPPGFNAVVMIEDVHYLKNGDIELIHPATPWQHVRTVGEDIVATELIVPEGHRIRPIDQGALLAAGITKIEIIAKPRVAVIPTGSELVQPGSDVRPGQII